MLAEVGTVRREYRRTAGKREGTGEGPWVPNLFVPQNRLEVFRKSLSLTLHESRPRIHILDAHDQPGLERGWREVCYLLGCSFSTAIIEQWFFKCGAQISGLSVPWKCDRNANSQAPWTPTESETLMVGASNLCFNKEP